MAILFDANALVFHLRSTGLHNWIQNLKGDGFLDDYERTAQTYIVAYILQKCFYGHDSVYMPRPIKIEERQDRSGDFPIPDISMPSTNFSGHLDVWVELKVYFGQLTLNENDIQNLTWDFQKASNNVASGGRGVVLIMCEDREYIDEQVNLIHREFESVELIIIGGTD